MEQGSRTARLVEIALGEPLPAFIAIRRRCPACGGSPQSWRQIAAELTSRTGVEISYEAVRQWHGAASRERAAA